MFSFITRSYLAYKWEVDYKGFNKAIRVTLASYHQSRMQGASMLTAPRKRIKNSKESQT